MRRSRRQFLAGACAVGAALAGFRAFAGATRRYAGPGPLIRDPNGLVDLAEGFSYAIVSRAGTQMDDGLLVPGRPDGMAAFAGREGRVVLVRNHELLPVWQKLGPFGEDNERLSNAIRRRMYDTGARDTPSIGGTTTLVYDPATQRTERHFLSLAGTDVNCSGGKTPWGTWVTCEETDELAGEHERVVDGKPMRYVHERDHGYNFEVSPDVDGRLAKPKPLKAMGRFVHESVAVDPATGIVYQTEDAGESLIYRFIPKRRGRLHEGGRLQALALVDEPGRDTRNWPENAGLGQPPFPRRREYPVRWVDLEDVESPDGTLGARGHAAGAALFARGEGMRFGDGELFWAATSGGPVGAGQIFRYRPGPYEGTPDESGSPGTLSLYFESHDVEALNNVDNICIAPWGDLICCEDAGEQCSIVGLAPGGRLYRIANNPYTSSEFAGACFSPDGRILFVSLQDNQVTLAITGPWPQAA